MRILRNFFRSFATKLGVLLVIFVVLPVILYGKFQDAYDERTTLLLKAVQEEGQLIARSLLPALEAFQGKSAQNLVDALNRLGMGRTRIKLLFRPRVARTPESFFYVASVPSVDSAYLQQEKAELLKQGILGKLPQTCEGGRALAQRYVNPEGHEEILTSITPVEMRAGCWVVITSRAPDDLLSSAIGRPYWQTPEVRIAGLIYLVMAIVVLSVFLGVWQSIRRFAGHARDIRAGRAGARSFSSLNRIPELSGTAEEFDRLVAALHRSAERIRQAAEENAHALKAPLAVISQSVEPLKSGTAHDDARSRRAIDLIERSVSKLDTLISAARRMDEVSADLIDPDYRPVDLSQLVGAMLQAYSAPTAERGPRFAGSVTPALIVLADGEMLETVVENLLDNAAGFSPPGGRIRVVLERRDRQAVLTVEDEGPGVPPELLERIFERYFSNRPSEPNAAEADGLPAPSTHFGIGLWIARRNVEALGGTIDAANVEPHGLRFVVSLPLAD